MSCKDCIYYGEVWCGRKDSDGNDVRWTVSICKEGNYIMYPEEDESDTCEMFQEGRDE